MLLGVGKAYAALVPLRQRRQDNTSINQDGYHEIRQLAHALRCIPLGPCHRVPFCHTVEKSNDSGICAIDRKSQPSMCIEYKDLSFYLATPHHHSNSFNSSQNEDFQLTLATYNSWAFQNCIDGIRASSCQFKLATQPLHQHDVRFPTTKLL